MAKSTLTITFINDAIFGDDLTVTVNNGSQDIAMRMEAVSLRTTLGEYQVEIPPPTSVMHQFSFVNWWNVDYKNIGGTDNIKATFFDNGTTTGVILTLDSPYWQFVSATGSSINGGRMSVAIVNEPIPDPKDFTFVLDTVDCASANYDITISGGTAPYTISGMPSGNVVTGTQTAAIQLTRGDARTIKIIDDNSELIASKQIVPPNVLDISHFTISQVQESGVKVTVAPNVTLKNDILPITYSINGVDYNSSGVFISLAFETQYTAYIQDGFGCIKTKAFITPAEIEGGDGTPSEYARYFELSNAGTGIYSLLNGSPTNPNDSMSFEELVKLPKETEILQKDDWTYVQQFKSSYNYHKITLVEGETSTDLLPVLQVENLNLQEKVDCKLFRTVENGLGIYFRNGNTYIPNTTTTNGTSDYDDKNLPSWAKTGNNMIIDGIGTIAIKRIATDIDRGLYIETDAGYTSATDDDGKVQANHNKQIYNVFEFAVPMSYVSDCATIFIEKGFNDLVETIHGGERIRKITDTKGLLDFQWRDPENKAGIVHQTGITHRMLLPYVKWVHSSESSSELDSSDDQATSLYQEVGDIASLTLVVRGFKMQKKIQLAAGMEEFYINGINYKKREMSSTPLGASNLYRIEAIFEFGGNELTTQSQELVLNPPETSLTNKPSVPTTIPNILAKDSEGLIYNGDGGFILVGDGS